VYIIYQAANTGKADIQFCLGKMLSHWKREKSRNKIVRLTCLIIVNHLIESSLPMYWRALISNQRKRMLIIFNRNHLTMCMSVKFRLDLWPNRIPHFRLLRKIANSSLLKVTMLILQEESLIFPLLSYHLTKSKLVLRREITISFLLIKKEMMMKLHHMSIEAWNESRIWNNLVRQLSRHC